MSGITIGLCVSAFTVVFFALLFRFEGRRGVRFGEHLRIRADVMVLKSIHYFHSVLRYAGRDFIQQVMHYLLHTLLRSLLDFMVHTEKSLRNAMRINKTLAKRAERESMTRSKLEEIALHKVESALTENEKRIHKKKMLEGHPHT